jgi:hydroxyacid-oxoacid transhydrogenase
VFEVYASSWKFGHGALRELGSDAQMLGMRRVAVLTDKGVAKQQFFRDAVDLLRRTIGDVVVFDEVVVEPTDVSFLAAAQFVKDARVDGVISIGGGSVMDTAKAANLMSCEGMDVLRWTNAPVGRGEQAKGRLLPHIAVPTTPGTGAEQTALAIYDNLQMHCKTGISGG